MSEGITEREALLEARIKQLESAAALRDKGDASGGLLEQMWQFLSAFVPPWIIGIGVAVFIAFHGWEYYNQAQMAVAETQLAKAQAALKDAEARAQTAASGGDTVRLATVKAQLEKAKQEAVRSKIEADGQNTTIGDEIVRVATVKAELDKTQQEATRAKIEADAQSSIVQDTTMRLATLKAELANKQAEADKATAAAEAANKRFGYQTLEERAATAKLILSELDAADARGSAAGQAALGSGSIGAMYIKVAHAMCANNKYARLINCPSEYVTVSSPPVTAPQVAAREDAPADTNTSLRKPTLFDCARASMGADFVICASDRLLEAEARLEDAYKAARAARGNSVKTEQIEWTKRYRSQCGLPLRGRPAAEKITQAKGCIGEALSQRIRELQAEQ